MERIAKMVPWERKVENERERGLLRGAEERMFLVMDVLISPLTLEFSYWTVHAWFSAENVPYHMQGSREAEQWPSSLPSLGGIFENSLEG